MNVKVTSERKDVIEFELEGESYAFSKLLMHYLLGAKNVESAHYNIEHPLLSNPHFVVKVSTGEPRDMVRSALHDLDKDVKSLM